MDISQIPSVTSQTTGTTSSSTSKSLSMDDFFTLLAAELQNQDPDNATSNDQFMQEMAQYSTLEATQSLVKSSYYSLATTLTGKTVAYNQTTTSNDVTSTSQSSGTVEAVDLTSDIPECYVSSTTNGTTTGSWVSYSDITQVYSSDVTNTSSTTDTGSTTTTA